MNIQQIHLSYNGMYLQAYRCGSGADTILLLHGAGLDNTMLTWKETMERLGKKAVVYAVDLPGFGRSDALAQLPEEGFYPFYHHVLEAVVDQLKLKRFVLCGLSMGGAIAIRYALAYPEQVCGLIAADAWGISPKMPSHAVANWTIHRTSLVRQTLTRAASSPALTRSLLTGSLFGRKDAVTPELVETISELCRSGSAIQSMEYFQKSSITASACIPYFGEELSRLKMPVLLVHGSRDPLVPLSHAQKASRLINNGRLHVMEGCKHWACKERPDEFCQVAWTFIKRDCQFAPQNLLPDTAPAEA